MEIIGDQCHGIYLVSVNRHELDKIRHGEAKSNSSYRVGDKIQVSDIYSRLIGLERNRDNLSGLANTIRSIATLLESVEPAFKNLTSGEEDEI